LFKPPKFVGRVYRAKEARNGIGAGGIEQMTFVMADQSCELSRRIERDHQLFLAPLRASISAARSRGCCPAFAEPALQHHPFLFVGPESFRFSPISTEPSPIHHPERTRKPDPRCKYDRDARDHTERTRYPT
jgi:hypothetical protein